MKLSEVLVTGDATLLVDLDSEVEIFYADLWPNAAERPALPTAEDIAKALAKDGRRRLLEDWGLLDDVRVRVRVQNPHWRPDPPLLPDVSPPRWLEAEVFV